MKTALPALFIFLLASPLFACDVFNFSLDFPYAGLYAGGVTDLSVVNNSGYYHMWFVGDDGFGATNIFYANSSDGQTWNINPLPVISPGGKLFVDDSGGFRGVSVVWNGTHYQMWYVGINATGFTNIIYAHSSNGIVWVPFSFSMVLPFSQVPVPAFGIYNPSVVYDPGLGLYEMWYSYAFFPNGLIYANSPDGKNWLFQAPAVGSFGEDPYISVLKSGSSYRAVYNYFQSFPAPLNRIDYAESSDGINWANQTPAATLSGGLSGISAVEGGRLTAWASSYTLGASPGVHSAEESIGVCNRTPYNSTYFNNQTLSFNCSFSSLSNLAGSNISIYNSSGLFHSAAVLATGKNLDASASVYVPPGNYTWNCSASNALYSRNSSTYSLFVMDGLRILWDYDIPICSDCSFFDAVVSPIDNASYVVIAGNSTSMDLAVVYRILQDGTLDWAHITPHYDFAGKANLFVLNGTEQLVLGASVGPLANYGDLYSIDASESVWGATFPPDGIYSPMAHCSFDPSGDSVLVAAVRTFHPGFPFGYSLATQLNIYDGFGNLISTVPLAPLAIPNPGIPPPHQISCHDLDGDGVDEVIMTLRADGGFFVPPLLSGFYVLNGSDLTQVLIERGTTLPDGILNPDFRVIDLDGDGNLELVTWDSTSIADINGPDPSVNGNRIEVFSITPTAITSLGNYTIGNPLSGDFPRVLGVEFDELYPGSGLQNIVALSSEEFTTGAGGFSPPGGGSSLYVLDFDGSSIGLVGQNDFQSGMVYGWDQVSSRMHPLALAPHSDPTAPWLVASGGWNNFMLQFPDSQMIGVRNEEPGRGQSVGIIGDLDGDSCPDFLSTNWLWDSTEVEVQGLAGICPGPTPTPTPTPSGGGSHHRACRQYTGGWQCIRVSGRGADECSVDSDCGPSPSPSITPTPSPTAQPTERPQETPSPSRGAGGDSDSKKDEYDSKQGVKSSEELSTIAPTPTRAVEKKKGEAVKEFEAGAPNFAADLVSNWPWILLLLVLLAGAYYLYQRNRGER